MLLKQTFLTLGAVLLGVVPEIRAGANSLARHFDRTAALPNVPVVVTASFTNEGVVALRGFFYDEQLPSGLTVTPLSVMLNGQSITNYTFETGQAGDVYPGCIPYRWVLERPRNFTETNPLPPQAQAQIVYAIHAAAPGTFVLPASAWAGSDRAASNACFGSSQPAGAQTISILDAFPLGLLRLAITNQQVQLTFPTQSGITYVVEYKNELSAPLWQTFTSVIGTGETMSVADAAPLGGSRFYRVLIP
jgi:hypothetical protein